MNKKIFLTVVLLAAVIAFRCGKETYTISVVDGVKYIQNHEPSPGKSPVVSVKFIQKIGDIESDEDSYQLFEPRFCARDSESNIYIADCGNYRIQKYDMNGNYIATIGRQGQGPGEFQSINGLDIDRDNSIYVSDNEGFRIQVFSGDGALLKFIKHNREISQFRLWDNDKILAWDLYNSMMRQNAEEPSLLCIYNNDGTVKKKFGEIDDFGVFHSNMSANRCWFAVTPQNDIFLSYMNRNVIAKYSPGLRLVFRAERPVGFDITPIERSAETGAGSEFTYTEFKWVSMDIDTDRKNRLWVPTFTKEAEHDRHGNVVNEQGLLCFHIFDQEGILLQILPVSEFFIFMRIFDDYLYLVDPVHEMCVYEYRIIEE